MSSWDQSLTKPPNKKTCFPRFSPWIFLSLPLEKEVIINTVFPRIVSALEYFPQQKFSLLGKKLKFAATMWIFYNLQIQKRIVSAETIHGNMVFIKKIRRFRIHRLFGGMIPWALLKFRNPRKDYQIQEIKFTSNIFTRHWGETLLLSMLSLDSAEFDSKAAARLAAP